MSKKHTIESVSKYFKDQGCELLETEYINTNTKLKYKCKCGNESEITLHNFQNNVRCMKCSGKEIHTIEFVKEQFKKRNCELLETKYINNTTKMKYICECGNKSETTFHNFQNGSKCMKCNGRGEKLTYENVYNFFKEQNCELLETEYIDSKTRMKYRCDCGNESVIVYNNFKQGTRCNVCRSDKVINTYINNYGVDHPWKNKDIQIQMKKNNIEKYGVEHPLQNINIRAKASKKAYKLKEYILPSGKIITCQGYETYALDILLKEFDEEAIVTETTFIPRINYQLNGKNHYYFPDIFLPLENKIIEVKSTWTYKTNLEKNLLKKEATKKLGYNFEFWIFDSKKNLVKLQ